jgi:monovalent cation/hydrogen antiporter
MLPPTGRGGLIVSWSGMRGIVTLAAALALPTVLGGTPFPFRGLIVFTAFAVVLGTLVVQGLTLRPLLQALNLHDDDPVGQEVGRARERELQAARQVVFEMRASDDIGDDAFHQLEEESTGSKWVLVRDKNPEREGV